jgi:hypothetical protein
MTAAAPFPEAESPRLSLIMRLLGVLILVVPLLGVTAHVGMYLMATNQTAGPEWWTDFVREDGMPWAREYIHGWELKAVAILAFLTLVGGWIHYRRTGMTIDIVARILTYLWLLSIILVWKVPT